MTINRPINLPLRGGAPAQGTLDTPFKAGAAAPTHIIPHMHIQVIDLSGTFSFHEVRFKIKPCCQMRKINRDVRCESRRSRRHLHA